MESLALDTKINYLSFLKSREIIQYLIADCTVNKSDCSHIIDDYYRIQRNYFYGLEKFKLYNLFKLTFFPTRLIMSFPVLKYQARFKGSSDYLDRIRSSDLTSPIMIGADQYSRPFIAIHYRCLENTYYNWRNELLDWSKANAVLTIFQRYTGAPSQWCKAGWATCNHPLLYGSATCLSARDKMLLILNILKLLNNDKIIYQRDDNDFKEVACQLNN